MTFLKRVACDSQGSFKTGFILDIYHFKWNMKHMLYVI